MTDERRNPNPGNANPMLFYIIVGVIVAAFAAFLIVRPHSGSAGVNQVPTTQH